MKNRKEYLNKLIAFRDKSQIKVITGVRRCGKSSLLNLFSEYLQSEGVSLENIVYLNFELETYRNIVDHRDLYDFLKQRIDSTSGKVYLLKRKHVTTLPKKLFFRQRRN